MYKARIKDKTQLNTSGVTLNADLEPKTHHQTPMTYGYSYFIHFKTIATEVEIQFLSTLIMFPSLLPQFGSAFSLSQGVHLKSQQRCSAGNMYEDKKNKCRIIMPHAH